jgi:hypothetical protein
MTELVIVKFGLHISKCLSLALNVVFSVLGHILTGNKIVYWVVCLADKMSVEEIKIKTVPWQRRG